MSRVPRATTRYEQVLAAGGTRLAAHLTEASRATRAALALERPGMPAARAEVVAGVAGPLLAGFVLWSLHQAQERGLGRLYFVARDGESMLRMARHLAPAAGADVDLRYLEGSRRTWVAAATSGSHDREWWTSLLEREEHPTVKAGLDWVRVAPEQVAGALTRAGLPPGSWDAELDADGRDRLVDVIVGPDVAAAVTDQEHRRAGAARAYLDHVGLLDGTGYGIVDGAGHANIGRLLAGLVRANGGEAPGVECYYGLQAPSHPAPGRQPRGYAYDEWRDGPGGQITDLWVALEMWTAAAHGRVEGYRVTDGRVRALRGPVNEAAERWGMDDVRAGLERYAQELAARLTPHDDPWTDVRDVTTAVAATFWENPTRDEVRAWGDYPFEASSSTYPVAQGFTTRQVLRSLRQGRLRTRRRGSWPAGTRMAASAHLRALLAVSMVGRRALATVRRALDERSRGRTRKPAPRPPLGLSRTDPRPTIERR